MANHEQFYTSICSIFALNSPLFHAVCTVLCYNLSGGFLHFVFSLIGPLDFSEFTNTMVQLLSLCKSFKCVHRPDAIQRLVTQTQYLIIIQT
jgi:hypothetical protein